jgi:hypothetical protein
VTVGRHLVPCIFQKDLVCVLLMFFQNFKHFQSPSVFPKFSDQFLSSLVYNQ